MYQLKQFEIVPFTNSDLKLLLYNYKSPNDKISKLIANEEIISIKKGLYVVSEKYRNQNISKEILANVIYGPSYISTDSALSYYGIIPEKVTVTASISPKRAKKFSTLFGDFNYIQSPIGYYSIGITQVNINNCHFLIACPEKALCDKIVFTKRLEIKSLKSMQRYVFDDLRIDLELLSLFDVEIIEQCIAFSKKQKELKLLIKLVKSIQ